MQAAASGTGSGKLRNLNAVGVRILAAIREVVQGPRRCRTIEEPNAGFTRGFRGVEGIQVFSIM